MRSIFKKVILAILVVIFIVAFSPSYSTLSIDNLAFVVSIGIDKSDTKNFKVSFEFVNISSSSEAGSTESSKIVLTSVDSTSLTNSVNMMNSYLGKKLDLSHCKIIVFSEEIAKDGISDEIYSLMNDIQIRPSANIVISKCNADYYIENSKPSLESLVTTYYDVFPNSGKYTGYVCNATIGDFFNNLICNSCQPYAILGGIAGSEDSSNNKDENDSDIKSGTAPIKGTRTAENIGTAVFKDDKLVGELNAIQTVCFSSIENLVDSFLITVPDPQEENAYIDIYLSPDKNTKIDVEIINGFPYIKIDAQYSGKIYSMGKNSKYIDSEVLSLISNACNKYLESEMSQYLYTTSTKFNSDINSFGSYATSQFSTDNEFENYNWLNNYKNSTFDVKINTIMDSGFLLNQT